MEAPRCKDLEFWQALREVMQHARDTLPGFSEPELDQWGGAYPWKVEAERQALEDDSWQSTDVYLERYCRTKMWPKRSKNLVRYFSDERLLWGLQVANLLCIPAMDSGKAATPRPSGSGFEWIRWLLIDAYGNRNRGGNDLRGQFEQSSISSL